MEFEILRGKRDCMTVEVRSFAFSDGALVFGCRCFYNIWAHTS